MHQLHGRGPLADRRRGGLLGIAQDGADPDVAGDPESNLAASAVSGQPPPAGPQWVRGLAPLEPHALVYDKPLPRCVLRPPIAQERFQQRPDGLVRITLKKAYTDGTVAVDMDPLSLLCRLATSVPPKALPHRPLRGRARGREPVEPRIAPKPPTEEPAAATAEPERPGPTGDRPGPTGGYRPWAELLARSFAWTSSPVPPARDACGCSRWSRTPRASLATSRRWARRPSCRAALRAVARPYWKSRVLRRQVLGDEEG